MTVLVTRAQSDVCSHNIVQGFQKTGLGERVATLFVRAVGKSTLGLAYGLSIAEALLAPAMPSTTARAGGIFMPIINSLSLASGSEPGENVAEPGVLRCIEHVAVPVMKASHAHDQLPVPGLWQRAW